MELSQVLQALRNADAAGDKEGARRLAEIAQQLSNGAAPAQEKPKSGIVASASKGIESLLSSGRTALGALTGDKNEAARAALERSADMDRRYADDVSFEKVKQAYEQRGLLPAAGEAISQIPKAIAEQAPNIGATLGAARLGAMAGSPFGPLGTVIGGGVGAVAPGLVQMFGSNVERQAAEQQKAGQPINVNLGAAGAAAAPQAALDAAAMFIPLGGKLVSKMTGIPLEALGKRTAAETAALAEEKLLATLGKGAGKSIAAEVPTEVLQQMLERAQAGLPLTSPDALKEYGETAYQVSLLAPIGSAGRISEKSGARQEMAAKADEERRALQQQKIAQEQEAKAAELQKKQAEEAYKQTPQYAQEAVARYEDLVAQSKALQGQLRKIEKDSPTAVADAEFNKSIKEQLAALGPQLKEAGREYNRAQTILGPLRAAEAAAQTAQSEQAQARMEQEAAAGQTAQQVPGAALAPNSPQATFPGMEQVAQTVKTPSIEDQMQQTREFAAKQQEMAQLLEAAQEQESEAAGRGDIAALKALRQRRQMLQNEYDFVSKQLAALGGVPVNDAQVIQQRIAGLQDKLKQMAGPGYDPAKADKLLDKIDELQAQLKQLGIPENAGVQQGLNYGRADQTQKTASWSVANQQELERRNQDLASQNQSDEQTGPFDALNDFYDNKRVYEASEARNVPDLARMERDRLDTSRTAQGTLFGEDAKEGIETGIGSQKTRQQLINDLRMARAARNAQPDRRAGGTQAVSQALEALRDYDARVAAEQARGTSKVGEIDEETQKALAGATVPAREKAIQSARELRDTAYADLVDIVSRSDRARSLLPEFAAAQQKLIDYTIKEVEFRRGEALSPEERQALAAQIYPIINELRARMGDTRNIVNVGTVKEPRYVDAAYTKEGGAGTGPTGMGLANEESRAPGYRTFANTFAAVKSLQEGIDQAVNNATRGRTGSVETTLTPEKSSAQALRKELDKAQNNPQVPQEAQALIGQIADNAKLIATRQELLDDATKFVYRANNGDFDPLLARDVQEGMAGFEQGKRSETEAETEMVPAGRVQPKGTQEAVTNYKPQPTGVLRTAAQKDFFGDTSVFDTPQQFQKFMGSDALDTMRRLKGLPGETATRTLNRLKPLEAQINRYEQQMAALRQQYDKAVAQKTEAEGLVPEAQAALQAAEKLYRQMGAKLEQQLAGVEADYIRASLKYNFTSDVIDKLTSMISKNVEKFSNPLDGLAKRYLKEIADAEQPAAKLRAEVMDRVRTAIIMMRDSQYTPEQFVAAAQKGIRPATAYKALAGMPKQMQYTPKQIGHLLGLSDAAVDKLKAYAEEAALKKAIYVQRQAAWMSDDRVIAALDEHLKLTMQLRAEERQINKLGRELMTTKLALQEARTQFENDPRVKARYAQQQKLADKARGDIEAARALLGESDATIRAISAQIKAIDEKQARLERVVKGTQKQVAEKAAERVVPEGVTAETQNDREARDAEARKAEQAALERKADDVNRKLVSFEPRRKQEEKRIRNADQIKDLQEQAATAADPQERAAAQKQLVEFMDKLSKTAMGAAKKLQGSINAQNKLVLQIQKSDEALKDPNLSKKARKDEQAKNDALMAKLATLSAKINEQLGSIKEDIPTRADIKAERAAQFAENKAESFRQLVEEGTSERLPARKIGPVVKNAVQAGNTRTGNLETEDTRKTSTQNPIRQSGTARTLTGKQAEKAAVKDTEAEQLMLRESNLSDLKERVEAALEKAQESKDAQQIAMRQEQLSRVEGELAKTQRKLEGLGKAPKPRKQKTIAAVEDLYNDVGEAKFQLAATATQGPKVEVQPESNAANVMDEITATSTNPLNRAVAERLRTLLGNTKIKLVRDLRDDNGNPVYGSAKIDGSEISLDLEYGTNEQTVLHEGVHAAIERALRLPEDQLTEDQRGAKRELEELFKAYKADKTAPNANAKQDISEFVAEALSDAELQSYLESKKWTLKNMWNAVKNGILRMLGVDVPTNMRDATLAAADRLMMRVVRPTAADAQLAVPSLNRPRLNAALADSLSVADKLVAKQQPTAQRLFAENTGLAFSTRYVDRFAGFEKLAKQMGALEGTQMLYFLRMYDQRMNFVAQSAGNGALELVKKERKDGQTEYLIESKDGASLRSVVETLKAATPMVGDVDATNRLFTMYLAAERANRVGFDKLNFGNQITEQDLKKAVQDIDRVAGLRDVFDRARREYNEYNEGLVRFAQQTGALSKETADSLLKSKDYIPFYRAAKDGSVELVIGGENPIRIGNVKEQPYLQELVGGDEPIFDFFKSSVQNTNLMVDMALRNLATKNAVIELAEMGAATITPSNIAGPDVVKFKVNGEDRYARIDTDTFGVPAEILVKGMEGIPTQLTGLMRLASIPTRTLRRAVTLSPTYVFRQIFRDTLAAPILSGADFTPVLGALKEIGSPAGDTLTKRGITGGQYFTGTQEDLSRIMREIADGKSGWAKALGKLEAFGMEADALTRRAQYNSYIKQGMSEMEATLLALESMNFNKRGASPSIHLANSFIPFFNAQIQGLNVLYRAMTGQATAAEKLRIQSKFVTRGALMMAVSLAYAAAMQDDEAYKNANPDQKYGNWFVRIPGVDEPVKLPVPFEVGYIFKALPEALYNMAVNGERGGGEAGEAFKGILRNVIPGGSNYGIPQVLKPAIEVGLGKSFYTGRDLLSAKEAKLRPEEQYRDSTSEIAKEVGAMFGISPIKIEALVNGYLGTLGLVTMQAGNIAFDTSESPAKAVKRLSDMPVVGGVFQPNDAGYIINSTYEKLKDAERVKASVDDLIQKGEKAKAQALIQEKANEYALSATANWFSSAMTQITKYETAIKASDMSPEEKRAKLDEARQYKIKLAATVRDQVDKTKPQ